MAKRRSCLGSLFTNLFLAALIVALYHATQPDSAAIAASAPAYHGSGDKAALQFTVSWNAAALSDIMDTLSEEGVSATFAVSGEWAENNPALLLRMASEGHEIASMGYYANLDGGFTWTVEDIERADKCIERLCGKAPELYYSGSRSRRTAAIAAKKLGLTHVSCTIDLMCARGSAEDIVRRIPEEPIRGSIILLQPTAECSAALPGILSALEKKGLTATYTGDVLG